MQPLTSREALAKPPLLGVLQTFSHQCQKAKAGETQQIRERLSSITIADLSLLRQELGISLGKRKPSRKMLTDSILSRLNESIMLSKHINREKIVGTLPSTENIKDSNPDNQV